MERSAHDGVMPKEGMDNSIQANGRNHPYPIVHHPHKGQQSINNKLCKKILAQLVHKHKDIEFHYLHYYKYSGIRTLTMSLRWAPSPTSGAWASSG